MRKQPEWRKDVEERKACLMSCLELICSLLKWHDALIIYQLIPRDIWMKTVEMKGHILLLFVCRLHAAATCRPKFGYCKWAIWINRCHFLHSFRAINWCQNACLLRLMRYFNWKNKIKQWNIQSGKHHIMYTVYTTQKPVTHIRKWWVWHNKLDMKIIRT